MALPKVFTATDTSGNGSSAARVSTGSIDSISATDTTNTMPVLATYMMAGPDHHSHRVQVVGRP